MTHKSFYPLTVLLYMVIGTLKLGDYGMFAFTLLLQFLPLQVSNIKFLYHHGAHQMPEMMQ